MHDSKTDPIAALVCGILAWMSMCCGVVPLVGVFVLLFGGLAAAIGLVLGPLSIFRVQKNPEMYSGKGLAIGGSVLSAGYFMLFIGLIVLVVVFGVGAEMMDSF